MNICLFSQEELSKPLPLNDERAQHIIKILHKKEGDTFSAGVLNGSAGIATIKEIHAPTTEDNGAIVFKFTPQTSGKQLYPLTLVIGFPRPIQLKRLLRDVAGLGACTVHLTGTELGEKSYMQSSLVESGAARQMLVDGTVQAASTHVPELFLHTSLAECLSSLKASSIAEQDAALTQPLKVALDNIQPNMSLTQFLTQHPAISKENKPLPVIAAIGSERGWTNNERTLMEQDGFTRCGMGIRVFRTETAATVASSIITAAMGAFDIQ